MDPTFVIGGQLLAAGANARLGSGQWLVAEADESDGSFLRLNPQVAVVTNIDADHLENYGGDFARVQAAFNEFLHRLPFYGLAVLCIDDAEVAALAADMPRHVMTYGFSRACRRARRGRRQQGGPAMHFTLCLPDGSRTPCTLALPGRHNVQNALAAAAVGWQLGVCPRRSPARWKIRRHRSALQSARELTHRAGARTCNWSTTTAITRRNSKRCSMPRAAAGRIKRLVVAFQPHRYSRTRDLFDDFAAVLSGVDALVLTEVYPAGEAPIAGADAKSLARSIRTRGRVDPVVVNGAADLASVLPSDVLHDGDLLLMMGAGDIGAAAQQIARMAFKETTHEDSRP
jgi:UDP-N-acetylmuramate--alanine ligase